MKHPCIALALLAACDRPPTVREPPPPVPPTAAPPAADPTPPAAPVATAAVVAAPGQLRVAFEGRCTGLGSSVLDGEVFVHFREGDQPPPRRSVIARLGPDARPAELLTPPRNDLTHDELTYIAAVAGRWPDQRFLRIGTGERGGYMTGYLRFDGAAWQLVEPFGAGGHVNRIYPWHSKSILAVGCSEETCDHKLAVIRGAPKAPRLTGVRAALGPCEPQLEDIAVLPAGPIVAAWRCRNGGAPLLLSRFTPDDLEGSFHQVPGHDHRMVHLADDGKDTVHIAVNPVNEGDPGALLTSTPGTWSDQPAPPPGRIVDLAVDRDGAPWVLQPEAAWRRGGDTWVPEAVGLKNMQSIVGVATDHPVVWSDAPMQAGALARREADGTWTALTLPPSTLFADQRFTEVGEPELDAAGDVWVGASYAVKRRSDRSPAYRFSAVLTTREVAAPMRCGEVLGKPMSAAFASYPTGVDATCATRLVLLQREPKWKPDDTYARLGKLLRGATDLGAPRFAELDIAGDHYLAAFVETDPAAQSLLLRARKLRAWAFPEVLCGDPAVLDRAGVQVHRTLALDAAGLLRPAPTAPDVP